MSFFQDKLERLSRFASGDMPFSVRRASYRSIILEIVQLLRNDDFDRKRMREKKSCRIIVCPARPLDSIDGMSALPCQYDRAASGRSERVVQPFAEISGPSPC